MNSQLLRCSTARGSSTGLSLVGPTKVKACKSFYNLKMFCGSSFSSLHLVLFILFVLIFFHWSISPLYLLILPVSLFITKIIDVYNDKDKAIDYCCDTILRPLLTLKSAKQLFYDVSRMRRYWNVGVA